MDFRQLRDRLNKLTAAQLDMEVFVTDGSDEMGNAKFSALQGMVIVGSDALDVVETNDAFPVDTPLLFFNDSHVRYSSALG